MALGGAAPLSSFVGVASGLFFSVLSALAALFLYAHTLVVKFSLGYVGRGVVLDFFPVAGGGGFLRPRSNPSI